MSSDWAVLKVYIKKKKKKKKVLLKKVCQAPETGSSVKCHSSQYEKRELRKLPELQWRTFTWMKASLYSFDADT